MRTFEADNFTELWYEMAYEIYDNPDATMHPRGTSTRAIIGSTMVLTNPRNRIAYIPGRKYSLKYAIAEFIWYLSGKNDLEMIKYYAPSMAKFSNDGKTVNSGYGRQLINNNGVNQIKYVIDKLMQDKDSRHAIIMIRDIRDTKEDIELGYKSKDIPCTLSLHFQIVNNELILIVNMRSQDLCIGKLYDTFCFTMLQELIYVKLKKKYKTLKLGYYICFDSNVHIYNEWEKRVNNMFEMETESVFGYQMPKMEDVDIADVVIAEESIRKVIGPRFNDLSEYWWKLIEILLWDPGDKYSGPKCYKESLKLFEKDAGNGSKT